MQPAPNSSEPTGGSRSGRRAACGEPHRTLFAPDPEGYGSTAATAALTRFDGARSRARTLTVLTRLAVRGAGEQPAPRTREG